MSAPLTPAEELAALDQLWGTEPTVWARLSSTDHKVIGKRYLVTAFVFFLLAGVMALVMRTQLAESGLRLLNPDLYDQLFSMHGTTMIFFFATPMLAGFGNYLVPLMIGTRDMAFPRLNAVSYWIYLSAGVFLYSSILGFASPNNGWFNYVTLANRQYSQGLNIDFYALSIILLGISSTVGAINFIVTILRMRAPGMAISNMPLFAWAVLATSFALVFALPVLTTANVLLELDRLAGFHFFDVAAGGNPLLWQHLFWIFGHPDVYIILLPAVGIVSTIVPVFSGRPIVGYLWVALAMMSTAIISFGVWVHHMFATGLPPVSLAIFGAASVLITVPSGIQIFAWLATMLVGKVRLTPPMLYMLGFLITFVLGGFTGVMFGAVPFDQQATDTYFVVAHFHYVLFGGSVFPILGGLLYWLPKMSGRLSNPRLGKWSFWLIFGGFHLTFFPLHIAGLLGMPRRVYTYLGGLGWDPYNMTATIGAFLTAAGVLVLIIDLVGTIRHGAPAGNDPWGADTLEWATTSPPPPYNFPAFVPVRSRHPLWDRRDRERLEEWDGPALAAEHHEVIITTMVEGSPDQLVVMPGTSHLPLALALSLLILFYGFLFSAELIAAVGAVAVVATLLGWWRQGRKP